MPAGRARTRGNGGPRGGERAPQVTEAVRRVPSPASPRPPVPPARPRRAAPPTGGKVGTGGGDARARLGGAGRVSPGAGAGGWGRRASRCCRGYAVSPFRSPEDPCSPLAASGRTPTVRAGWVLGVKWCGLFPPCPSTYPCLQLFCPWERSAFTSLLRCLHPSLGSPISSSFPSLAPRKTADSDRKDGALPPPANATPAVRCFSKIQV